MSVSISRLSFEHHRSALGIAETSPRISWRFDGDEEDWVQESYDIEIIRSDDSSEVFSVDSSQSLFVDWPGEALRSAEAASVRARAHGKSSTPWSDWVTVETGLLTSEDWGDAVPIRAVGDVDTLAPKRPTYFRKPFTVGGDDSSSPIAYARLYITSLGLYEAEINGQRVGDHVMAPGWQSYHNRHVYDTYDVTDLVKTGENAIGVLVGEGWFAGRIFRFGSDGPDRNFYGENIGLVSLLVVELEDGTIVNVPSDTSWTAGFGPVQDSQIYNGEIYDSRLEEDILGWSSSGFDDSSWNGTQELPARNLVSPDGPPIRRTQELDIKEILTSPSGKTVLDFEQNLAGWLKVTVQGPSGTNITLTHAEVLEDGEIATRPLRSATQQDHLILHGNGEQTWEPKFTYHGFRYVQVDNWPANETALEQGAIKAIVVHSDMEETGSFESSHDLLNKFHENVRWSMRSNFFSVPTDCPQRDERVGWTGDAHVFGPTSNFLYNSAGFWRGWHKDVFLEMSQRGDMIVSEWVPNTPADDRQSRRPVSVWGDVGVANPWNLWTSFGDEGLLAEQYSQAKNWITQGIPRNEDNLWDRSVFQYGDWLDPKAPPEDPAAATTSRHLVADAYLVQMTGLLANASKILGYDEDAELFATQHGELRSAFNRAWVTDGHMANETQTAYALGIQFDLFEDQQSTDEAGETLRNLIAENNYLVGTGFAGTHVLGHALTKIGGTEDFYSMLLQTQVPSWLYQVVQNGTTTWERWDSLLEDGSVNPGSMTSFNHYAFGSVADWIHKVIGGLSPASPGWKDITISPIPGGDITTAKTSFISGYGIVSTDWYIEGDGFYLTVHVPPNSRAAVNLPNGGEIVEVGSGTHQFEDLEYGSRRAEN